VALGLPAWQLVVFYPAAAWSLRSSLRSLTPVDSDAISVDVVIPTTGFTPQNRHTIERE
jgi:hypothetical protein